MDKGNFLSILKSLTDAMKCPKCGQSFNINEVQFVEQLDGFCLLQLSCEDCKTPIWVNFFATDNKPNFKIRFESAKIEEEFNFEPITTDEVISFHNMIKEFDGDFKKVFRR